MVVSCTTRSKYTCLANILMQSTRSATKSLPKKEETLAESRAASSNQKPKPTSQKRKRNEITKPSDSVLPKPDQDLDQAEAPDTDVAASPEPAKKPKKRPPKATTKKSDARRNQSSKAAALPDQLDNWKRSIDPTRCCFLDLPPELRNEIYSYILSSQIVMLSNSSPRIFEPAILAANRQVRSETISLFYADNTFAISGSSPANKLLRNMSDQKLRALRALRIITSQAMSHGYIQTRIEQFNREFMPRGLDRLAIMFQLDGDDGGRPQWVNLGDLRRMRTSSRCVTA